MAEKQGSSSQARLATEGKEVDWASMIPKRVDEEDAMSAEDVAVVWSKMMGYAGLKNPGEMQQLSFRLAVYVYGCKNGASRVGNYAGQIKTSDGHVFDAAVIPRAAGKHSIRRFFRGCMIESYQALKKSEAMLREERFIARCASIGVPAEAAFATADWLRDCPLFTPLEAQAHNASFAFGLEKARRSRGGETLEEVERAVVREGLETQGPATSSEQGHLF